MAGQGTLIPPEKIARIRELLKTMSLRKVAKELRISTSTVQKYGRPR